MLKICLTSLSLLLLLGIVAGCGDDPLPSHFDPNDSGSQAAIINAIEPSDSALAGVGEIRILGENFQGSVARDVVYFNTTSAKVTSASTTELVVITPNFISDTIQVKVAAGGAFALSNSVSYQLKPAAVQLGTLEDPGQDVAEAWAVATDLAGDVYVSTGSRRIKRIKPDGTTTVFVANASFLRANAMKLGPGNTLYAVAAAGRLRLMATFAQDGTETRFTTFPADPKDFDFDSNLQIWTTVANDIYLVRSDGSTVNTISFAENLVALRVFDGHVYVVAGTATSSEHKIWRSAIQGEGLGQPEEVLDATAAAWLEGASVLALTFSADGVIYLGTNHPQFGMFLLHPDGSNEPLYPGLIEPQAYALSWGEGQYLHATIQLTETAKLLRISTATQSAPYFGRR